MAPAALAVALAAVSLAVPSTPVVNAPCPQDKPIDFGCYYPPPVNTIYLEDAADRLGLLHEQSHAADALFLDDGERRRIACHPAMLQEGEWTWRPCKEPWSELYHVFTDAYVTCRTHEWPLRRNGYGYEPTSLRRHVNMCRLVQRALSD
jgi:hypothetical protein